MQVTVSNWFAGYDTL